MKLIVIAVAVAWAAIIIRCACWGRQSREEESNEKA
jgi:hypothetical protein